MKTTEIITRVFLAILISGIIGYEREKNQSSAGLKTHILVCISATIIALIQSEIDIRVLIFNQTNPDMIGVLRADPARLIAQVVSGIGFLGAGTIIVTKRNVSGLTTAASIWSVACLGIALGMGYYKIVFIGFIAVFIVLFVIKRFLTISTPRTIVIKYLNGQPTQELIKQTMVELGLTFSIEKYDVQVYSELQLYTNIYEIQLIDHDHFDYLVELLAKSQDIISIHSTNL